MRALIKVDPEKLTITRLNKGWSIRELARISKVSRWTIIRLEKGSGAAEKYTLQKLANALNCNVEHLKEEA